MSTAPIPAESRTRLAFSFGTPTLPVNDFGIVPDAGGVDSVRHEDPPARLQSTKLDEPGQSEESTKSKSTRRAGLGFDTLFSCIDTTPKPTLSSRDLPEKAIQDRLPPQESTTIPSPLLSLPAFFSSFSSNNRPHNVPTAPYTILSRHSLLPQALRISPLLFDSPAFWLSLYFAFNLGITLLNKHVLLGFPFPYTITALHASCGSAGGWILRHAGVYEPTPLRMQENIILIAFSSIFTLNISISNASLHLVSIPFHQVIRATTPIFAMIFSAILMSAQFSPMQIVSLFPIIAGVVLAAYGDFSFTSWGFCLTLLGAVLAALKGVLTNVLQSTPQPTHVRAPAACRVLQPSPSRPPVTLKLGLHPLDMINRLSVLALVQCIFYARISGEFAAISTRPLYYLSPSRCYELALNGILAFGINIVSFYANRKAGPVSMSVAANVKQVLTTLLAVSLFDVALSPINSLGILLSLFGGAWYARVEYVEKRTRSQR